MKKKTFILLLLVLSILLSSCATQTNEPSVASAKSIDKITNNPISDSSTPKTVVAKYFNAVKGGDLDTALTCFTPTIQAQWKASLMIADSLSSYFKLVTGNSSEYLSILYRIVGTEYYENYEFQTKDVSFIDSSKTSANVTVEITVDDSLADSTTIYTRKIDDVWYIDEDVSEAQNYTYGDLDYISCFSHNASVVRYNSGGGQYSYGIINDKGNLLKPLCDIDFVDDFDQSGYTYYQTDDGFVIVDYNGNETYRYVKNDPESSFQILAHENESFILREKWSSFSESVDQIRIIDIYGNDKGNVYDANGIKDFSSVTDAGEGLYYKIDAGNSLGGFLGSTLNHVSQYLFMNTNTGCVFDAEFINFETSFYNGIAIASMDGRIKYLDPTQYFLVPITIFDSQDSFTNGNIDELGASSSVETFENIGEGLYYDGLRDYFMDYTGETIINMPEFAGSAEVSGQTNYFGDYCIVYIRGGDGKKYCTLMDKTGNTIYEPVCIEGYGDMYRNKDGIIACYQPETTLVIYTDGTTATLSSGELTNLEDNFLYYNDKIVDVNSLEVVFDRITA